MRGFIKVIIVGAVILGLGIGVLAVTLGINGWQIDSDFEIKTFECQEKNTTLDIDFSAGSLEINWYEEEFIKIEYPESSIWTSSISESNGTVSFANKGKFKWNNIPSLFVKVPMTKIWIPLGDILNVKLDMSAGTVKLAGGEYDDINIQMNAGTISTTGNISCDKLTVKMSAGTINTNDVVSEHSAEIQLSAGSLNIQSLSCPSLDVDVSAGAVNINNLLTPSIDVDLSAGSVKLDIIGATKSDYNIDVDKSAGSCNITNQKGSTNKSIKADVSAGSLTVKFVD